jgi:hypothetical protein
MILRITPAIRPTVYDCRCYGKALMVGHLSELDVEVVLSKAMDVARTGVYSTVEILEAWRSRLAEGGQVEELDDPTD